MNYPELVLVCERCGQPVDRGGLWVGQQEISIAQREHREWDSGHAGQALSMTELFEMPEDLIWKVHHEGCTPEPDVPYMIGSDQLETWASLAHWTAHLMEKTWFQLSDWDLLLREVAGEGGSRRRIAPRMQSAA